MLASESLIGQSPAMAKGTDPGESARADERANARAAMEAGWMLLRVGSGAVALDGALLDRLGLKPAAEPPDGAIRLTIAGVGVELVEGGNASRLAAALGEETDVVPQALGVDAPPAFDGAEWIGLRLVDGRPAARGRRVQRLCAVVALLAELVNADLVYWSPAALWSSAPMLAEAVKVMERQGLPPLLHLVAFRAAATTAELRLTSRGLDWFAGHEIRLITPSSLSATEALRRAARLAVDAMLHNGLEGPMTVDGIEAGEKLTIGPVQRCDGGSIVSVDLHPATR